MNNNIYQLICKCILILFLSFVPSLVSGQIVKKQIGTSVWKKNGVVIRDSTISYVISFDKFGRKTSEWQIYANRNGDIRDTEYVEVDTADRVLYQKSGAIFYKYEYDKFGTTTQLTYFDSKDTIIINYYPHYNSLNNQLVSKEQKYNGDNIMPIYYSYIGDTVIEKNGSYIEKTVRNNYNQVILLQMLNPYSPERKLEVHKYLRNEKGQVLKYTQEVNGELFKQTNHSYDNGIEESQIEHYYHSDIYIFTNFKYEYW